MTMLTCGCGRPLQLEGVVEADTRRGNWLVRLGCRGCSFALAAEATPEEAAKLVERPLWTDEARHLLDRMPPYVEPLVRREVEEYARARQHRIISVGVVSAARHSGVAEWDPEAERRLANVPATVRAMARMELERTAAEKGESRVTVALMEEVKARYFGVFGKG
jgi:hypothetical protein